MGRTFYSPAVSGRGRGWVLCASRPTFGRTHPQPLPKPGGEHPQAEQPDITLTGLYNLVEKLRRNTALTPAEADTARRARAAIILELHRRLDAAVAAAYGWEASLAPAEIVARLVALNAARAAEEAAGTIRWLRPDYQAGRAV